MKNIIILILLLITTATIAQPGKGYRSMEEALATPEQVYELHLSFKSADKINLDDIIKFTNLKRLKMHCIGNNQLPEILKILNL
jgi:hypothetical protein